MKKINSEKIMFHKFTLFSIAFKADLKWIANQSPSKVVTTMAALVVLWGLSLQIIHSMHFQGLTIKYVVQLIVSIEFDCGVDPIRTMQKIEVRSVFVFLLESNCLRYVMTENPNGCHCCSLCVYASGRIEVRATGISLINTF